jgi:acyl carrier protein phosphodiesterase
MKFKSFPTELLTALMRLESVNELTTNVNRHVEARCCTTHKKNNVSPIPMDFMTDRSSLSIAIRRWTRKNNDLSLDRISIEPISSNSSFSQTNIFLVNLKISKETCVELVDYVSSI